MSTFNLNNVLRKKLPNGAELINCEVRDNNGDTIQATIWKLDKDNKVFPNFDSLSTGSVIEGNLWNKPGTTTWVIYPPKPVSPQNAQGKAFTGGTAMIAKKAESIALAQDKKAQSIEQAQSRNEVLYAKLGASEIMANHPAYKTLDRNNVEATWKHLVKTILNFNPNSTISAEEADDLTSSKELDESYQRSINSDESF